MGFASFDAGLPGYQGFNLPGVQGVSGMPSSSMDLGFNLDPSMLGGSGVGTTPDFSGIGGSIPQIGGMPGGGAGGFFGNGNGLGFNMPTAQLAMSGLQTIGNLWNSFQANSLAKKAFNFQKNYAATNLANQTSSYNTALEDKINSRAFVQGMSPDQANSYLASHKLSVPDQLTVKKKH